MTEPPVRLSVHAQVLDVESTPTGLRARLVVTAAPAGPEAGGGVGSAGTRPSGPAPHAEFEAPRRPGPGTRR
jgi:hypothetical protein